MKLTETPIRNHWQLLPNHKSKLQPTDPEFIELLDNFAYEEVITHGNLDLKTRLIMIHTSTIGSNVVTKYKAMVSSALNVGVSQVEIKEVLYHGMPYVF
ncbi:MAG: hypothetical protein C0191_04620 [Mucilaginibacter sp.]|nr:MAG: hypothetical protein C0191_04620 [Mucilaginibacter sp.]HEK22052.1 carboxymuconolactone decarboxylase family protein [Bacteroidota bacterium]